ncbi:MAG TPA: hypothetical protein VM165_15785 [Planctomycetaceae bacterium]|nr:hypothetical protein [Planctomycetaceae bacterium]
MRWYRRRRPWQQFVGSAGVIGFLAGAALAGQIMIWCGCFRPGVTPNGEILDYWPGFLIGAAFVGFAASFVASTFWAAMQE